jgi:MFS family permease
LDKVNVGFAALQMNKSLGFSNTAFGLGAGLFSIGFVAFSLPGTLLLRRFGARQWMGLIVVACSLFSAAMAFITRAEELWILRALLGMAEASIAPGMIVFLGYWFPAEFRGRAWSTLLLISPLAFVLGGPVSGVLLNLQGVHGLEGWQWLFITEAVPTFLLGIAILFLLTNKPNEAHWLSPSEKTWLERQLASELPTTEGAQNREGLVRRAFTNGRLQTLAAIFFGFGVLAAGPLYFFPSMVRTMGFSTMTTGMLVTLPAIAGGLSLPLWGYCIDHLRRTEIVLITAGSIQAVGSIIALLLLPSPWALLGLSVSMIASYGANVSIAMLPSIRLTGAAAAAAIGINYAAVQLGVFIGSYLIGRLMDLTGTYTASLASLALIAVVVAILGIGLLVHATRMRAPLTMQASDA